MYVVDIRIYGVKTCSDVLFCPDHLVTIICKNLQTTYEESLTVTVKDARSVKYHKITVINLHPQSLLISLPIVGPSVH